MGITSGGTKAVASGLCTKNKGKQCALLIKSLIPAITSPQPISFLSNFGNVLYHLFLRHSPSEKWQKVEIIQIWKASCRPYLYMTCSGLEACIAALDRSSMGFPPFHFPPYCPDYAWNKGVHHSLSIPPLVLWGLFGESSWSHTAASGSLGWCSW